jgi:hypothetical protein
MDVECRSAIKVTRIAAAIAQSIADAPGADKDPTRIREIVGTKQLNQFQRANLGQLRLAAELQKLIALTQAQAPKASPKERSESSTTSAATSNSEPGSNARPPNGMAKGLPLNELNARLKDVLPDEGTINLKTPAVSLKKVLKKIGREMVRREGNLAQQEYNIGALATPKEDKTPADDLTHSAIAQKLETESHDIRKAIAEAAKKFDALPTLEQIQKATANGGQSIRPPATQSPIVYHVLHSLSEPRDPNDDLAMTADEKNSIIELAQSLEDYQSSKAVGASALRVRIFGFASAEPFFIGLANADENLRLANARAKAVAELFKKHAPMTDFAIEPEGGWKSFNDMAAERIRHLAQFPDNSESRPLANFNRRTEIHVSFE